MLTYYVFSVPVKLCLYELDSCVNIYESVCSFICIFSSIFYFWTVSLNIKEHEKIVKRRGKEVDGEQKGVD